MIRKILALAAAAGGLAAIAEPALAQGEQFLPSLVYRTGPYAPNGIPFANGVADYWTLINERDGGINGVKIVFEECETGYATDKGVECYERLKGKGATVFQPLSTGITFAITEKAPGDKIPLDARIMAVADAYATAALAMGEPGLSWLAERVADGYESAVVTDDGRAFTSANLPVAP